MARHVKTITITELVGYACSIGFISATEFAVITGVTVDEWCGTCLTVVWLSDRTWYRTDIRRMNFTIGTFTFLLVLETLA